MNCTKDVILALALYLSMDFISSLYEYSIRSSLSHAVLKSFMMS